MEPKPVKARMDYGPQTLGPEDLDPDPIVQLQRWLADAAQTDQLVEPSAMALATVGPEGRPSVRTMLLRQVTDERLLFFTSYASRKAADIAFNPEVSLLFRWANPQRQVEVQGRAEQATAAESDAYFAARPRGSQVGAHVSPQSQIIPDREWLDRHVAEVEAAFEGLAVIPRPADWGGYAVRPTSVEFWQGNTSRLHDRVRYRRGPDGSWTRVRLAP